jgi:hypothetical protein
MLIKKMKKKRRRREEEEEEDEEEEKQKKKMTLGCVANGERRHSGRLGDWSPAAMEKTKSVTGHARCMTITDVFVCVGVVQDVTAARPFFCPPIIPRQKFCQWDHGAFLSLSLFIYSILCDRGCDTRVGSSYNLR